MKNFLYNKSDLLTALAIIAVAALVILFRVNAIMDYPLLLAGQSASNQVTEPETTSDADSESNEDTDIVTSEDDGASGSDADAVPEDIAPPEENPPAPAAPAPAATPPAPAADARIDINSGTTTATIADQLLTAGLITDKQTFLQAANAAQAETKLRAGTFYIPAGSSVEDIIKILTR